jgi:hypothetical protein
MECIFAFFDLPAEKLVLEIYFLLVLFRKTGKHATAVSGEPTRSHEE